MEVKKLRGKANTDGQVARAEANQLFIRETLAQRQPQYARTVNRVAEAVVRDIAQRRRAAQDVIAAVKSAMAVESREQCCAAV